MSPKTNSSMNPILSRKPALTQQSVGLAVTILQGKGTTNTTRRNHQEIPVAKVVDSGVSLVSCAKVTFRVPDSVASAMLKHGKQAVSMMRGAVGQREPRCFTPNFHPGNVNIRPIPATVLPQARAS
jgi:hypothetical protein